MQSQNLLDDFPLHVQRIILRDRSQQYYNMLQYVHDLKPAEREQITEWMIQTDELIASLPPIPPDTDDEIIIRIEMR